MKQDRPNLLSPGQTWNVNILQYTKPKVCVIFSIFQLSSLSQDSFKKIEPCYFICVPLSRLWPGSVLQIIRQVKLVQICKQSLQNAESITGRDCEKFVL